MTDTDTALRFRDDVEGLIGGLLRQARRLTHNHADAEDLVQETLVRAFVGYQTFEPGTNMKAWLWRIMRNEWINAFRCSERRPREVFGGLLNSNALAYRGAASHDQLWSVEDKVLQSVPDGEMSAVLAALTDDHRLVLYYADIEGYSYREVSKILNVPVGTVMSRLHRARRRVRGQLGLG